MADLIVKRSLGYNLRERIFERNCLTVRKSINLQWISSVEQFANEMKEIENSRHFSKVRDSVDLRDSKFYN